VTIIRTSQISAGLSTAEIQTECRAWQCNEVLFTPVVWEQYEPIIRADFALFDTYHMAHGRPSLLTPVHGWAAEDDARCPRLLMELWGEVATSVMLHSIKGGHMFLSDGILKAQWLAAVLDTLDGTKTVT
jgi:surfactin synthase thioesterase subunit